MTARASLGAVEELDAVIIGATIRGLVTAHVLSALGHRAVLVERSSNIGAADSSFVTDRGNLFDHGLHVVDARRSDLTTKLFFHVVDGAVHRTVLRRAIALRGYVMPYAPAPSDLPPEIRCMLPGEPLVDDLLVDDLGDGAPTRERLGAVYGQQFADLVFDEVLASFPAESRHRTFGVDESRLLTNIYPWFFPRAKRSVESIDESRAFHDKLRAGVPQEVLYPEHGGFAGFANGFLDKLDRERIEVLTSVGNIHVEIEPGTHRVEWVGACDRRFRAPRYFWAEGWAPLCRLLGLPCQDVVTDRVVLGSFRLDRPPHSDYHEILVGDPALRINRIHFPSAFRHSDEPLMQIEFAYPIAEDGWELDPPEWRDRWLADAKVLGVLDTTHGVDDFDFRSFTMHFNAYGAEGVQLVDADPTLLAGDSNLHPVVPSMANLNLNRYVPRAVRDVTSVLMAPPA